MMPKKNWTKNNLTYFAISLVGIGLILGYSFKGNFFFSKEINPVELLTLFVTIFLAWYFSIVIEKNRNADRGAKELFISRISSTIKTIDDFFIYIHTQDIKFQNVTLFNKSIRISIDSIYKLSRKLGIKLSTEKENNLISNLKLLKMKTTYTSPRSKRISTLKIDLAIKNNILIVTDHKLPEIANILTTIKDELFTLQIEIYNS